MASNAPAGPMRRAWRSWRRFRRTRPFWAATWAAFGGFQIAWWAYGPMEVIIHAGLAGVYGLCIGAAIMGISLVMLLLPSQRYIGSVLIAILGVISFPITNVGGFFFGMFFSILGASMGIAWMPEKPARKRRFLRKIQPTATPVGT